MAAGEYPAPKIIDRVWAVCVLCGDWFKWNAFQDRPYQCEACAARPPNPRKPAA